MKAILITLAVMGAFFGSGYFSQKSFEASYEKQQEQYRQDRFAVMAQEMEALTPSEYVEATVTGIDQYNGLVVAKNGDQMYKMHIEDLSGSLFHAEECVAWKYGQRHTPWMLFDELRVGDTIRFPLKFGTTPMRKSEKYTMHMYANLIERKNK